MFAVNYRQRSAALLVFAVGLVGCGKKDEPTKADVDPKPVPVAPPGPTPSGPTPPKPAPPESLTTAKPDVVIAPGVLREESNKDYNFLFNKYPGKIVDVTGLVDRCIPGSVFLQAGKQKSVDTIRCVVGDEKPWRKVFPSQTVTLRARVITPFVWEVVDVKGPPPPTLTAEQYVREKANAPDDFEKKHKNSYLIVTGVVTKAEHEENGSAEVFLDGGGKERILCTFTAADQRSRQERKALLKVGQKVKLLGDFASDRLMFCELMDQTP